MPKKLVRAFWQAMGTNDFSNAAALLHPEFEHYMPQSREYLRGRENFIAFKTNYPANGLWKFTIRTIIADNNTAVSDVQVTDGTVHARAITFHDVQDDLIRRQTEYWPDDYPAPDWRKEWVKVVENPPFG